MEATPRPEATGQGTRRARAELTAWCRSPDPDRFPYDTVVAEYHRVGKHFVARELLEALAAARDALPEPPPQEPSFTDDGPRRFLDNLLDKFDDRYDYTTYLALGMLPVAGPEQPPSAEPAARRDRDRMVVLLIADALRFETAAAAGETAILPQQRPDAGVVGKRLRHGVRVVGPLLARLGLTDRIPVDDPGRVLHRMPLSEAERRTLSLSMLPVDIVHDEYLFIRVLQAFELTFTDIASLLLAGLDAIDSGQLPDAAALLTQAGDRLTESAPLFSLAATVQIDAFREFRQFTQGASAIQSRAYKLIEATCSRPAQDRLDSVAYESVPDVRERALRARTLDEAFLAATGPHALPAPDPESVAALGQAMHDLARIVVQWRRKHYRLAVRMLGEAPGTGYVEGAPYLSRVKEIPLFRNVT